ncbi:MAG: tripartite tricarboxylate transporter substrate binding protein [Candidatus Rokubacteria bacterium]|nr:tripartite tricarboxylate transporter substrate binding protein [Candidatus Rokubacteria bacterium]
MMRSLVALALALGTLCALADAASAQAAYPAKPVTLLVPYGAGGTTDLAARALAKTIPQYLGQPVVVVNKPGSSGAVAWQAMLESPADGYTLMMAAIGTHGTLPAVNPNLPFKYNQFATLGRTQVNPTVLVVRKDSPWNSVKDVIEAIRKNPGTVKGSVPGLGSMPHLALEILVKAAGLPKGALTIIPYKSDNETITALMGGHADANYNNLISALSQIKSGQVRALAHVSPVTGQRVRDLPDVPTFPEAGVPQMNLVGWRGVLAPPGVPAAVVEKWEGAIKKMTEDLAWRETVQKFGDEPAFLGATGFAAFIEAEHIRYKTIASEVGIVVGR